MSELLLPLYIIISHTPYHHIPYSVSSYPILRIIISHTPYHLSHAPYHHIPYSVSSYLILRIIYLMLRIIYPMLRIDPSIHHISNMLDTSIHFLCLPLAPLGRAPIQCTQQLDLHLPHIHPCGGTWPEPRICWYGHSVWQVFLRHTLLACILIVVPSTVSVSVFSIHPPHKSPYQLSHVIFFFLYDIIATGIPR